MSFSFASLWASAENAMAIISADAAPLVQAARGLEPIIEGFVPSSVPIITGIEAGAASIGALAPTAVQDATAVIAAGKKIVADGSPLLTELEALFDKTFHVTSTPGGAVLLTPKTSSAMVPAAAAPGN